MPELPEVETVRAGLTQLISGRRIRRIDVLTTKLRFEVPAGLQALEGQRIDAIDRRAKYLLFRVGATTVLSHLGMTGTWQSTDRDVKKHDHLVWTFDDGTRLIYNDPRKFGFVEVFTGEHPRLIQLGPEPLDDGFNADYLRAQIKGRTAAIKALLMDQDIVVGVGNIYATEALFRAGISPKKPAGRVKDLDRLVHEVKRILAQAIALGGSSIDDFRKTNGQSGYFQNTFAVYGKAKQPCPTCAMPLSSARIGGRGTVFCRRCQR